MIAQRILVLSRTIGLVREVQAAAGSGCAVVHHDRISDLEEFLAIEGPFDLLVGGPVAESHAALVRLAKTRGDHPAMAIILAFAMPPRVSLSEIVRAGAVDFVELPVDAKIFRSVVRRALALTPVIPASSSTSVATPAERPLAEVFTVASPSGGCGKTFYSTNLAHYLQKSTGQRVCLVDLDLQFGEVSAALRLKPRYTMTDAVTRSELEDIDLEDTIEEYLLTHPAGFWVLPAPRNPAEADQITPPDVTKVITALRGHFDYLVLDTSAQLSEIVLAAMDQSTRLICMATLDLPSIRNMRVFIETLEKLKVPTDAVSVILNKVESDMGIKIEEANEALHSKIVSVLPYAREVSRSINEGVPVLISSPKASISNRLIDGMRTQIGGGEVAAATTPAAGTWFAKKRDPAPAGGEVVPPRSSDGRRQRRRRPEHAPGGRRRFRWWSARVEKAS